MADKDILQLKNITDKITEDEPSDKPEILTVIDNLIVPITYQQRDFYLIIGSIILPEVIVPYKINQDRKDDTNTQ